MDTRVVLIVGSGTLCHVVLGRWVSPWLMPDLTLLSVLLTMLQIPGHPLGPALLGGVLAMVLAVHHPVLIGLAYLGAGWVVKWLAAWWDVTGVSMQRMAVGVAEGLLLTVLLMLSAPVTGGLLLLGGLRLAITILCLPLVRAVVVRVIPA